MSTTAEASPSRKEDMEDIPPTAGAVLARAFKLKLKLKINLTRIFIPSEYTVLTDSEIDRFRSLVRARSAELPLLSKDGVIQWLIGIKQFSVFFLEPSGEPKYPAKNAQSCRKIRDRQQKAESEWMKAAINNYGKFGERLCSELLNMLNIKVAPCELRNGHKLDGISDKYIFEFKSGTHYTGGTAHEKAAGTPLKYADEPFVWKRSFIIVCVGRCELVARNDLGCLPGDARQRSPLRQVILELCSKNSIYYVGGTDLIKQIITLGGGGLN